MSENQELLDDYERTKPQDTDFRQQRLRSWQPLLIPRNVIISFIILGCIFFPIGFAIWDASTGVVEISKRYDNQSCDNPTPAPCVKRLEIPITDDIPAPVYVYYKLTNFFQNHRRYVKSRSDTLLSGDLKGSTSSCDPIEDFNEKTLYPCGLIATSFFNDTFSGSIRPEGADPASLPEILSEWTEKGISWSVDRSEKFVEKFPGEETLPADSEFTRDGPNGRLPYLDNEHLMNWMRSAAFPTFRKLYAFINRDLKKGDVLFIDIQDNFNTVQFDGSKSILISNATWIGGTNMILAYLYIGCGAFCFFVAIIVLIKQCACPRKLGRMAASSKLRDVAKTD